MLRRRWRPFSGADDAPRKGKKTGKHTELTTNPFQRSVRVEDDRRGGSMVEQASSTSNGGRGGWAIPAGEKPDWGFGKVEEVPRKVPA